MSSRANPERAVTAPPAKAARNRSFDAFRAIFIFAVMLFHYLTRWTPPQNPTDLYGYDHVYSPYFELGAYGVHAFFMISGLFITLTLLRSADALDFAYKRLYRIYPAFVICATISFVVLWIAGPEPFRVSVPDYLMTLTLVADNLGFRPVDGAYWSLAVEIKFYFWVALSYLLFRERFWLSLIGLALAGALVELALPKVGKEVFLAPYMSFFLAGIGLAYHAMRGERRTGIVLYAAAAIAFAWHWDFLRLDHGPAWVAPVFTLGLLLSVAVVTLCRLRIDFGPLPYLGLISYEIYLIHQKIGVMVIGAVRRSTGVPDVVAFLVASAVVVALAALVHHMLQKPLQGIFAAGWAGVYPRLRPLLPATQS